MRLLLSGANGRMGKAIAALVAEKNGSTVVVGGIDKHNGGDFPIFSKAADVTVEADVMIDFSNPSLLEELLAFAVEKNMPIVLATTGYSPEQIKKIEEVSKQIPIFFSANMSLGVNLLAELCKKASAILGENYDVEIIEKHHNQKLDAPSGTALLLADAINEANDEKYHYEYNRAAKREKRNPKEIGIHAVRGGTIVGEHDVLFAGPDEIVTLSHSAGSRNVFASGSIRAAEFLEHKPAGLYSMKDIVAAL